jgi:hypothetical protein
MADKSTTASEPAASPEDNIVTIEELYVSSTGASNLRVEADRRTSADVVIAAGMSKHKLGLKLHRLRGEWDRWTCAVNTRAPTPGEIEEIRGTLAVEKSGPHQGLVREEITGGDGAVHVQYSQPGAVAHRIARARHQARLMEALGGLKSGPAVRDCLSWWMRREGFEAGVHLVAPVLLWWLQPRCHVCNGTKKRIAKETSRPTNQPCTACRGRGEANVPYGGPGRRVLALIDDCRAAAGSGIGRKFARDRSTGRDKGEKPELLVQIGERWRSRDGRLWDISGEESSSTSKTFFAYEAGAREPKKVLFKRNGRPFGALSMDGPVGMDLVELVSGSSA